MKPLREIKSMQCLLFSILICFCASTLKAQNVYYEAFNLSDGTSSDAGTSSWGIITDDLTLNSGDVFSVQDGRFQATDIDGNGIWYSQSITISGISGGVDISIDASSVWAGSGDYIGFYYEVDGSGSYVEIATYTGYFGEATATVSGVTGNTLRVGAIIYNNGTFDTYTFDNVKVSYTSGGGSLYSRANGDWDVGTTWSTTGHNGTSCNCFPNEDTEVIIGGSDVVNLTTDGHALNMTIENGATLRYTVENTSFYIEPAGTFQLNNGGTIDENSMSNAGLIFQGTSGTSQLIAQGGSFNLDAVYQTGSNTLEISGAGSITTGRLILSASGSVVTNNLSGTLSISDDLYFDNSNQTFNNNGTVTISDEINTGLYLGFIPYSNITITNNASATLNILDAISISNSDVTINNYGVLNQSGNFTNIDNGSSFNNLDGGTWNWTYAGTNYDNSVNTILDCSNGTNTFNYGASGTQNIIPVTYSNLMLSGSGTKRTQDNLDVDSDLSLAGTSTLDVATGADTVYLAGNWVNSGGTFTEGSAGEAVIFDGSGDQTISNATGETFNHLNIDKSSGTVSLTDGDVLVNGDLTLTAGNIALGDQQLTLGNNAGIIGGSAASFVVTDGDGQLIQNDLGAGARTGDISFPVGAVTSSYTPLIINNTTGTADNFGVKICAGIYNNGSCGVGTEATEDIVNRSWFISEALVGGSDATLTFQWNASNELTNFYRNDLTIIHHNGSEWEDIAFTSATGSGPYTTSVANVNSFSPFGIKTTDSHPLPIQLVSFSAKLLEDDVQLRWVTASELNNDFFTIEKTVDFKNFEEVAVVKGKGTFNGTSSYTLRDDNPNTGISYYRLKQTDYDGAFTYSEFVAVNKQVQINEISLYPVPNNGEYINVSISGISEVTDLSLMVFDITGMVVYTNRVAMGNNQEYRINFREKLAPGIYTLQVGNMALREKFIVHEGAIW